jgi:hypothetical protein
MGNLIHPGQEKKVNNFGCLENCTGLDLCAGLHQVYVADIQLMAVNLTICISSKAESAIKTGCYGNISIGFVWLAQSLLYKECKNLTG